MLNGHHLIGGEWRGTEATFSSDPAHGAAHTFGLGVPCAASFDATRTTASPKTAY